jgi:hypothetical protein
MVDEQELKEKIEERLRKPWCKQSLFNKGLMFMPGVKRKWENIQNAMRSQPDT